MINILYQKHLQTTNLEIEKHIKSFFVTWERREKPVHHATGMYAQGQGFSAYYYEQRRILQLPLINLIRHKLNWKYLLQYSGYATFHVCN